MFLCLLSAGVGDICAWRWTDILGKVSKLFHIITLFRPMEYSIKLHTIKRGWYIVYIEGSQVMILKKSDFFSLKIDIVLANSADPDEMSSLFAKVPI